MVAASGVGQMQHPDRLPLAPLTGELKFTNTDDHVVGVFTSPRPRSVTGVHLTPGRLREHQTAYRFQLSSVLLQGAEAMDDIFPMSGDT
jgi:hypothetical protein